MNILLSNKVLIKKVNFLLSSVNLSLGLLTKLSKRKIYKLFKKAQKINSKLNFTKQELKEFSASISEINKITKKETKLLKKVLKLEEQNIKVEKKAYTCPFYVEPTGRGFINKEQVLIC